MGQDPELCESLKYHNLYLAKTIICLITRTVSALKVDFSSLIKSKVEYNKFGM